MKFLLVLVLLAVFVSAVNNPACVSKAPRARRYDSVEATVDLAAIKRLDDDLKASMCVRQSDGNEAPIKEQCRDVCLPGEEETDRAIISSQTCVFGSSPWYPLRGQDSLLCGAEENFKGVMIQLGHCVCDDPLLGIGGDFFTAAIDKTGQILEKYVCPLLKALDIVVALMEAAIPGPGKAVSTAMLAAIKSAKTYKYAHAADEAATEWAHYILNSFDFAALADCPTPLPSEEDLVKKAFGPLSNAADTVIPGGMNYDRIQCPRKGCRGCRGAKCKEDDNRSQDKSTTMSCKALAALDKKDETTGSALAEDIADDESLRRRSRNGLRLHHLHKRARPKQSKPCGAIFESFRYPSRGEWSRKVFAGYSPRKFGYTQRDSCENYDWSRPDSSPGVIYHTEHVLEWQTVGRFFEVVNEDIITEFVHPDPMVTRDDLSFCEYWKESWSFDRDQKIENPVPVELRANPPATNPSGAKPDYPTIQQRSPFEWIASQYPFRDIKNGGGEMWLEEFTLLEVAMNSNNKARLFMQEPTRFGAQPAIRSRENMERLVKGISREIAFRNLEKDEQARIVVQRLRDHIGAVRYMQDRDVERTFANEKNRIGTMIRYLDESLHKTPREVDRDSLPRSLTPWKKQDLGDRWDRYMDDVFETAKQKATTFMNTYLDLLDKEWDSQAKRNEYKPGPKDDQRTKEEKRRKRKIHQDLLGYIKKAREEWNKVKRWDKPANW